MRRKTQHSSARIIYTNSNKLNILLAFLLLESSKFHGKSLINHRWEKFSIHIPFTIIFARGLSSQIEGLFVFSQNNELSAKLNNQFAMSWFFFTVAPFLLRSSYGGQSKWKQNRSSTKTFQCFSCDSPCGFVMFRCTEIPIYWNKS